MKDKLSSCKEMKNKGQSPSILSLYYPKPQTSSWDNAYFCKNFFPLIFSLLPYNERCSRACKHLMHRNDIMGEDDSLLLSLVSLQTQEALEYRYSKRSFATFLIEVLRDY